MANFDLLLLSSCGGVYAADTENYSDKSFFCSSNLYEAIKSSNLRQTVLSDTNGKMIQRIHMLANRLFKRHIYHTSPTLSNFYGSRCYSSRPNQFYSVDEQSKMSWSEAHRNLINECILYISNSKKHLDKVKALHIPSISWRRFLGTCRRLLVKSPSEILHSDLQTFRDKMKVILTDPLSDEADHNKSYSNDNKDVSIVSGESFVHNMKIDLYDFIFDRLILRAQEELKSEINSNEALSISSDLRIPHEWYPYARIMRRKIIYHGGPTNSGKTYHALQSLREASSVKGGGLYCGPLRLLALEVYESLNRQGVYTDLLTGQEQRRVPFSTHISCTLEMVNINREYDVAVIDEIQMISNPQRGYAWTRALLGLRAREIHLCGGLEASAVVKTLVDLAGDEFELINYNRLSTLKIDDVSLEGDYSKIRPGDCVVAFSRGDLFSVKKEIERLTPYKCCMIYGQLPPELRSTQARLFNEENTGYDVLVASDAIGMGLNLNIRRVVFHTTVKSGGQSGAYWVDPSSIKQIAGRAGRMSSKYKVGEVTAWQNVDLAYVKGVMGLDIPQILSAGLFPSVEQIQRFSEVLSSMNVQDRSNSNHCELDSDIEVDGEHVVNIRSVLSSSGISDNLGLDDGEGANSTKEERTKHHTAQLDETSENVSSKETEIRQDTSNADNSNVSKVSKEYSYNLSVVLEKFLEASKMDGRYFMCEHDEMVTVSNWLHPIPLTLADRFQFANAPVNTRDHISMNILYSFAASYALRRPVALNIILPRQKPRDVLELTDLCSKHNMLELYIWLSFRFPDFFIERELCLQQKAYAVNLIENSLLSPQLQQNHSHVEDYQKVRRRFKKDFPDGLPPAEWGLVRERTKEFLQSIPPEKEFLYPNSFEKYNSQSKKLSRERVKKPVPVSERRRRIGCENDNRIRELVRDSKGAGTLDRKATPGGKSDTSKNRNWDCRKTSERGTSSKVLDNLLDNGQYSSVNLKGNEMLNFSEESPDKPFGKRLPSKEEKTDITRSKDTVPDEKAIYSRRELRKDQRKKEGKISKTNFNTSASIDVLSATTVAVSHGEEFRDNFIFDITRKLQGIFYEDTNDGNLSQKVERIKFQLDKLKEKDQLMIETRGSQK